MVTELESHESWRGVWLLRPTRSMTWPEAKRFVLLVTLMCLSIGGAFACVGLWMVMPFCGIEALAVALAFYVVLRDGERREWVRFEGDQLVIETGKRKLEQRHEFNCLWLRVHLSRSSRRHHPHADAGKGSACRETHEGDQQDEALGFGPAHGAGGAQEPYAARRFMGLEFAHHCAVLRLRGLTGAQLFYTRGQL